jgi:hypothetical protein
VVAGFFQLLAVKGRQVGTLTREERNASSHAS